MHKLCLARVLARSRFLAAGRFVTMNPKHCCQDGTLVIDRLMPARLLSLISALPGFSKPSRAGNDLFRFAQMALP